MNNTHDTHDKVALVTGGGRGMGAAIALRLAADGADAALTYVHDRAAADEVAAKVRATGRRALAIRSDAADEAAAPPWWTGSWSTSVASTSWSTTPARAYSGRSPR